MIVLSLVILSLGFVMAYYIYSTVENLRFDARIINETGIIRGSIQRATKLVLSDTSDQYNEIFDDINSQFDHFIEDDENRHDGVDDVLFQGILNLREEWRTLEGLLIEFQENPSEQIKDEIAGESEQCWEAADSVVLTAQFATEVKMGDFELFYKILAVNAITAILVVLHAILYVRKKLEYESAHDSLTGLFNRRSYDNIIQSEIARSARYSSMVSLIIFDVDKFKLINDNYGHGIGDRVFIDLAREVKNSVRESDMVFRVGGDEFAIICAETTAEGASLLAEKVRGRIERFSFATGSTVTISMGVAEYQEGITKEQLYQHADQALYYAKKSGRNRTEIWTGKKL